MSCNDYASNCNDPCGRIDELLEAANALVNYRDIIEKWLHGSQNDIVQIGGQDVKTLLGLIADIKQLIGVLPDGKTIILNDTRKVLSVLLAADGGIKVKPEGGLYVNINTDSGLKIDEDGKISIDFSLMPTDRFEELMKQIRVPIWLTSNKNFYVNGATGSDTLDDGRGESEEKPFKTIQACVNYVTDNYNVSRYVAYINVKNTVEYNELITLPDFSRTTGKIVVCGKEGSPFTIKYEGFGGFVVNCLNGNWSVSYANIYGKMKNNTEAISQQHLYCIVCNGGLLELDEINIDFEYSDSLLTKGAFIRAIFCGKSDVTIYNCYISLSKKNNLVQLYPFVSANGGNINFPDTNKSTSYSTTLSGNVYSIVSAIFTGKVTCNANAQLNKYSFKTQGTFSGKKYLCSTGGSINTNGQGPDYFPGTTPGTVDEATYCWYA